MEENHLIIKYTLELIAIIILLILSGLFSASEVAFFSLPPAERKKISEQKNTTSKNILKCLENPEKLLATILILNNTVNIGIVILATYFTYQIVDHNAYPVLSFILEVIVITFVILLIGEIIPKIFATRNSTLITHFMAGPLRVLMFLTSPISLPLIRSSQVIHKRLQNIGQGISVRDLSSALEITSDSLKEEKKILEGIVKFGNIEVRQVMRSRLDIVAINFHDNFERILSVVIESGYSRIPVYEDSIDNIKGILIAKDIFPYLNEKNDFHWQGLLKPAYYVPETKKIDDLLAEFQRNKVHLAIVVDEHGGTSGLITMEDILEEIVGEIEDESDKDEEIFYKKLSPNCWLFEAKTTINDFCKILDLPSNIFEDISGNFETLAGVILEITGEIPSKGKKIYFPPLTFEIENVDNKRIRQVKVWLNK